MKSNMKAFTLVEMLIVIVIIGILAAALIPRLTGIQARSRDVARKADAQQITTALATYQLDNNTYPATGTAWTGAIGALSTPLTTYLKSMPKESQGTQAPYGYFSNGNVAFIGTVSEGGGVNANWTGAGTAIPGAYSGIASTITSASQVVLLTTSASPNARYIIGQ